MGLKIRLALCTLCIVALSGCRKEDPFYAPNHALIDLMDVQDRKTVPADKYVIHGGTGHLFYLEDLRAAVVKWGALDSNVRLIGAISRSLKAQGIRLLIVPVPTKVETYPELLGGRDVPDLSPSKDLFLRGLDEAGVERLDLRKDFFGAKRKVRLFPRTDTHWDQEAIILAAGRIATWMTGESHAPSAKKPPLADTLITGFQGDMAEKFRLDPGNHSDTLRLAMVEDGSGRRFAEPDSFEALLYGDSFLNQFKRQSAHLGAHLSRASGLRVGSVYSLAGFTNGPDKMMGILRDHPETRWVVWVFTSRTLMETVRASH